MTEKRNRILQDDHRTGVQTVEYPCFSDEPKAKAVLARAMEEASQIERQAYENGYHAGEAAGMQVGLNRAAPSVAALAQLVENLNQLIYNALAAMEPDIIRLVLSIAEKVICTTIETDSTVVVRVVKAALREAEERWDVTVRVNPGDLETLKSFEAEWRKIGENRKVVLLPDPEITPGGCVVQTPAGFIDAVVSGMLERLGKFGD